jgi:hypothetical protein
LLVLLARHGGRDTQFWMLVALMLQQRILPPIILLAVFNFTKVSPLLFNTVLSGHMLKTHMTMEGPTPVLSLELAATILMWAMHGLRA